MKRIVLLIICAFLLAACKGSGTKTVEEYLNKYNSLDESVEVEINKIIDNKDLSDDLKEKYREVFHRQYEDLTYEITNESYDGNKAVITVNITVYDYYKASKRTDYYLENNADEFKNSDGIFEMSLYDKYRLDYLYKYETRVNYTIDFYLTKEKNEWKLAKLSNSDLEKIHGIYNYEKE